MGVLKVLFLAPIALALVVLGVANRQSVTLLLDPFGGTMSLSMPLFVVVFVALAVGAVLGYVMSWFAQGRHRKAERHFKRECDRLSGECERLKAQLPATGAAALLGPRSVG